MLNFKEIVEVKMMPTPELATDKAYCAIIMTEWDIYKNLNLESLLERMNGNVLIEKPEYMVYAESMDYDTQADYFKFKNALSLSFVFTVTS